MISGFGENKFHKRYLGLILEKAKSLNIYNIDDIALADELCCKDEFEEFKEIFIKYFNFLDPNKSYNLYKERIQQEKKEIINYLKEELINFPNKKSSFSEIEKLKKLISEIRKELKKERQQCPFCVRSLKKLKFHLFRINIEQKLLGCKYFQEEIAKKNNLEDQLKLYCQALKYGAPNIKYDINIIREPTKKKFINNPIKNNLDALEFCRFLWRVLVEKRKEDILINKEKLSLKNKKSLIEKDSTQENDVVIKKEKFSNDFYRNLNSFQNDTFSHEILSEENDNIVFKGNLDDLVKKGIMEKIIVGTNNNNILTGIKRERTIFK
jgi:hypothetical protein